MKVNLTEKGSSHSKNVRGTTKASKQSHLNEKINKTSLISINFQMFWLSVKSEFVFVSNYVILKVSSAQLVADEICVNLPGAIDSCL